MFRYGKSIFKINQLKHVSIKFNSPTIHTSTLDRKSNQGRNPVRYNVCREHVPHCKKFVFDRKPVITDPNAPEDDRDDKQGDGETPKNALSVLTTTQKGYRPFMASNTRQSVVLPLKPSKLSSPFPAPVKVMPSHTVSDLEKAEQMQAEFTVPRAVTKKAADGRF